MPPSLRRQNPEQNDILNGKNTVNFSSQPAKVSETWRCTKICGEYFLVNRDSITSAKTLTMTLLLRRYHQEDKSIAMVEPHGNDILMGRGGKNNQHIGNEKLRGLARLQSEHYRMASKKGKSNISRELVRQVRLMVPPGRFLKKNTITGDWEDVGDDVAREKASQVLRDAVSVVHSPSEGTATGSEGEEEADVEKPKSNEKRRPVSAPPIMATMSRRRTWHETMSQHQHPPETMSHHQHPQETMSHHMHPHAHQHHHHHHHDTRSAAYTTPRQDFYPPVTPSSQSVKRRRYHSEYWADGRVINGMPTTPVRHPYADVARSYSAPGRHLTARDYATPRGLLGDVGTGFNEFDLFNGELLHSDDEESSPPPPTDLHNDTF